jgi:hypothetical protein
VWTEKKIPLILITTTKKSILIYSWNGYKWIKKTNNKLYGIKIISAVWKNDELHIIASKYTYFLHIIYKDNLEEINILPFACNNFNLLAFNDVSNTLQLFGVKNSFLSLWEYNLKYKKWSHANTILAVKNITIIKFFYKNNWALLAVKKGKQLNTLSFIKYSGTNNINEFPIIKFKNIPFEKDPFILINNTSIGILGLKKDNLFLLISHNNGFKWDMLFLNHYNFKYTFEEIYYLMGEPSPYTAITKINNIKLYSPIIMHLNDLELLLKET